MPAVPVRLGWARLSSARFGSARLAKRARRWPLDRPCVDGGRRARRWPSLRRPGEAGKALTVACVDGGRRARRWPSLRRPGEAGKELTVPCVDGAKRARRWPPDRPCVDGAKAERRAATRAARLSRTSLDRSGGWTSRQRTVRVHQLRAPGAPPRRRASPQQPSPMRHPRRHARRQPWPRTRQGPCATTRIEPRAHRPVPSTDC